MNKYLFLVFALIFSTSCVIDPISVCEINQTGDLIIYEAYYEGNPDGPALVYYQLSLPDGSVWDVYIGPNSDGQTTWTGIPIGEASIYIENTYILNNGSVLIEKETFYFDIDVCNTSEIFLTY